jgi:hypothetical protein
MAEKSLESTQATSLAGEGLATGGTLRRVDPSHRAPILVRIPNVHQPQQPSDSLWEKCRGVLLAVLKFLIPAPPAKQSGSQRPPETALASAVELPAATPAPAVEAGEAVKPAPGSVAEKLQLLTRAIETLAWLRARPTMAVPGLVASVLGTCGMLHMMLSSPPEEPSEGPEVFMGSPVGVTGIPPLGSATSVQPATGDGNMAAPTDRMADESAPPYTPYGTSGGNNDSHGPVLVPAMPGVARLKGRIEPLTPTVDSRNDQDRQGIR